MIDDEPRSEEVPPTGWLQGVIAFRKQHEEQRRSFVQAATSVLYQGTGELVLPYHFDVLAVAQRFLEASMFDVAVIMAQTACEIATDDIMTALLRHQNLPAAVHAWITTRIKRRTTLNDRVLYDLYNALTGDDLHQNQALWQPYVRRTDRRNDIVHAGLHATKPEAVEAYDSALALIHHFETVRMRVIR